MGVPVIEEILTFIQNIITWFVNVVPSWAKVIIALFMVMFLANWFVPVFLGFGLGCTTGSQLYTLNSPLAGVQIMSYKTFNDLSSNNSAVDYSSVINRTDSEKSYLDWLVRFAPCYLGRNTTECSLGAFDYWRYQYPSNYSETTIQEYNAMVVSSGTPKIYSATSQDILTPKCSGTSPKLYLFNKINLFDPTLWLIITALGFIIPFAIKWYEINHIF
jgi:hypothetical protein